MFFHDLMKFFLRLAVESSSGPSQGTLAGARQKNSVQNGLHSFAAAGYHLELHLRPLRRREPRVVS